MVVCVYCHVSFRGSIVSVFIYASTHLNKKYVSNLKILAQGSRGAIFGVPLLTPPCSIGENGPLAFVKSFFVTKEPHWTSGFFGRKPGLLFLERVVSATTGGQRLAPPVFTAGARFWQPGATALVGPVATERKQEVGHSTNFRVEMDLTLTAWDPAGETWVRWDVLLVLDVLSHK